MTTAANDEQKALNDSLLANLDEVVSDLDFAPPPEPARRGCSGGRGS